LSLQNRENGAILPFLWDARKLQGFQLQGGAKAGALHMDLAGGSAPRPHNRLAFRAHHVFPNFHDFPPSVEKLNKTLP